MRTYRDLRAWNESIDLVELVYRISEDFPARERFGLAAQMRGAAVSIPSNIAEGQGRITRGEWLQFLGHARGSLFELQTQMTIATRLGFGDVVAIADAERRSAKIGSSLTGLINYVRTNARTRRE